MTNAATGRSSLTSGRQAGTRWLARWSEPYIQYRVRYNPTRNSDAKKAELLEKALTALSSRLATALPASGSP